MNRKPIKRKLSPERYVNFLFQECRKYGIDRMEYIATTLELSLLDPTNRSLHEIIKIALADAKQLQQTHPDPFRPTNPINEGILTGNILLGAIPPKGIPYLVPLEMCNIHMLITSRTGGGKTSYNYVMITQILERRQNADDF